jgi:hypothetical protein
MRHATAALLVLKVDFNFEGNGKYRRLFALPHHNAGDITWTSQVLAGVVLSGQLDNCQCLADLARALHSYWRNAPDSDATERVWANQTREEWRFIRKVLGVSKAEHLCVAC